MLNGLFAQLEATLTLVVSFFGNLFNGVVSLVWDSTANSGAGEITLIGILLIIGVVMNIFWIGFRLVRNLVKMRG